MIDKKEQIMIDAYAYVASNTKDQEVLESLRTVVVKMHHLISDNEAMYISAKEIEDFIKRTHREIYPLDEEYDPADDPFTAAREGLMLAMYILKQGETNENKFIFEHARKYVMHYGDWQHIQLVSDIKRKMMIENYGEEENEDE